MKNAINWFEIAVSDYDRAKKFYSEILGAPVTDHPMPDPTMKYGLLPYDQENQGVGGAILEYEMAKPSADGTVVYLNGGEDLSTPLAKIEPAGGEIIMPKTAIGEAGFMAHFIDTEGNRIALHSMK